MSRLGLAGTRKQSETHRGRDVGVKQVLSLTAASSLPSSQARDSLRRCSLQSLVMSLLSSNENRPRRQVTNREAGLGERRVYIGPRAEWTNQFPTDLHLSNTSEKL